jgi:hypothetical protein
VPTIGCSHRQPVGISFNCATHERDGSRAALTTCALQVWLASRCCCHIYIYRYANAIKWQHSLLWSERLPVISLSIQMQATSSTSPSSELRLRFSGSDPYDFVHWYPLLSCIKTIPAAIIPVQYATALALKRVSEDYQYRQQLLRFCGDDVSKLPPRSPLPQELDTLSSQIDEALVQNGWGSVFVRMSDRSPKDAVYQTESFWQILDTQLARAAQEKSSATEQTAADVVAFIRASCFAQRVTSGAQAVQLLARSKRIRDDVSRVCLMQGDGMGRVEGDAEVEAKAAEVSTLPPSPLSSGAAPFALSVIIRPWLESIAPEYEFR